MTCESIQDLLIERLDGPLSPEAEESLTAHLAGCAACNAAAADLSLLHTRLTRAAAAIPLNPADSQRILVRIAEPVAPQARPQLAGTMRFRRARWFWPLSVAASLLLAGAVSMSMFPR